MKYPLILIEEKSNHIALYMEASYLTDQLEAIDVENNEYRVYDSQGQIISLGVKIFKHKLLGFITAEKEKIFLRGSSQFDIRALEKHIRRFLMERSSNTATELQSFTLSDLMPMLKENAEIFGQAKI